MRVPSCGTTVAILLFAALAGCSRGSSSTLRYSNMKFRSVHADGRFQTLDNLYPLGDSRRADRAALPKLYVRLDGKTVLYIPDLTPEIAALHYQRYRSPAELAAGAAETEDEAPESVDPFVRFVRRHGGKNASWLAFGPTGEQVDFSFGLWSSERFDPGIELSASPAGPFHALPLTRARILELCGPPEAEFDTPYTYAN